GDMRNIGIENAINIIDDLQAHVGRSHASVGAQSNSLQNSLERSQILEISTMTLRSDTIDTDLAEASLTLTQLQLNYQAMLSTVGKVSQLSLVNYL
ncbi:MAG: flagellar biosynthesis protein FlgL, partial [Campylobacterales bacterium]